MIKRAEAALGLPVLLLAGGLATSAHAAAGPAVPLPLSHFSHLAVDAPHNRLLLGGGAGGTALAITDPTGASRYFHHTAHPTLKAAVTPNKAGRCTRFVLQEY